MEFSLFLYSFLIPALIGTAVLVVWWLFPVFRKQVWLRGSILGIAVGTYSSIFVASPIVIMLRERYGTSVPKLSTATR